MILVYKKKSTMQVLLKQLSQNLGHGRVAIHFVTDKSNAFLMTGLISQVTGGNIMHYGHACTCSIFYYKHPKLA